jgi:hypothetical protein
MCEACSPEVKRPLIHLNQVYPKAGNVAVCQDTIWLQADRYSRNDKALLLAAHIQSFQKTEAESVVFVLNVDNYM